MTNTPGAEKLERRSKRPPQDLEGKVRHWPSWAISLTLHVLLFLLLAWYWKPLIQGSHGDRERPIGIAIVHQNQGRTEYFLDASGGANQASSTAASINHAAIASLTASQPAAALTSDELLGEFASAQANPLGAGQLSRGRGEGLSGVADAGVGSGKASSAKSKTQVFGVEGSGNSFVYVFDRSESMNSHNGAPLRFAKREMIQSIQSLTSVNQFQIVFYNESPSPYRGATSRTRQLIFATDTEKDSAVRYIQGVPGSGGTEHSPALRVAMNLSADVLFFLTDAADPPLTQGEIAAFVERCVGSRTTIHSIEFGTGASLGEGRWIEQLAKRTGGQYRYIDVTQIDR